MSLSKATKNGWTKCIKKKCISCKITFCSVSLYKFPKINIIVNINGHEGC